MIIRWRAVDLAEAANGGGSTKWTKVHRSNDGHADSDAKTLCGLKIPDHPYDSDMDGQVPVGVDVCKTCEKRHVHT